MRIILVLVVVWQTWVFGTRLKLRKSYGSDLADDSVFEDEQTQRSAYSKNLLGQSRKLLRRMQKQHDTNSESLAECYDQLGRYTRLLLAQRSAAGDQNLTKYVAGDDRVLGFKNYAMFMMQTELSYYLLDS